MLDLKPWTLPLIVAGIAVPIAAGFVLAGTPVGVTLGFLAAAVIVVVAVRLRPDGPIEPAAAGDERRHVLVVVSRELDDPGSIDLLKERAGLSDDDDAEVRVLAPAKMALLDRWASDVGPARAEAQRKLVVTLASLETAHVAADARVGDEAIVQAVEDELRTFPATQVVLVTGPPHDDRGGSAAAAELERRLPRRFVRIAV